MSSGPLTQLVAIGAQDSNYLSTAPQDSIFIEPQRKFNNYVKAIHSMQPLGNSNWGTTTRFKIEKKGDMLNNIYFVAKLPELNYTMLQDVSEQDYLFSWVNHIGHVMIENVKLYIGGQLIDEQSGEITKILDETYNEGGWREKARLDCEYISSSFPNRLKISSEYIYVPLQFWFCTRLNKALPLIALQYHDVEIEVKIRDWDFCYRVIKEKTYAGQNRTDDPNLQFIRTNYQFSNKMNEQPLEGVRLDCCFIYLDSAERKRMAEKDHKLLITQCQEIKCQVSQSKSIDLDLNHPVRELFFYFSADYIKKSPEPLNFSAVPDLLYQEMVDNHIDTKNVFPNREYGWNSGSGVLNDFLPLQQRHILGEARLLINGHVRSDWKDYKYYSYIQNNEFYKRCVDNHVYKYSFSGNPANPTPIGSLNFSRVDNAQLQIKINETSRNLVKNFLSTTENYVLDDDQITITVVGVNYNYLLIKSGMAGLAYNN